MITRVPDAAELLDHWEYGLQQPLARRMLALLAAACPEASAADIAVLPIGRRDARLLELRERLFGPTLTMVTSCPGCGERLQSVFAVSDLRSNAGSTAQPVLEFDGYRVTFRLPASIDLLALSPAMDRRHARRLLLSRCLLDVCLAGEPAHPDSLPDHVAAAVAAQMSAADPQMDVELNLSCPSCNGAWSTTFDIANFLWKEIHAWAKSMLRGVHGLARAYGWREADVLALSPTRRQIYLELARQ
jgi:uncharacterized protein (UPF0212 family)